MSLTGGVTTAPHSISALASSSSSSSLPCKLSLSLDKNRRAFIPPPTLLQTRFSPLITITFAKRKPSSPSPSPQKDEQVLDGDFRDSINQLSTDAVRAMLSDDSRRMEDLRDKIFDLEMYFEKEEEEEALLFVNVIRDMLDHRILPEARKLKGYYQKAFQKIVSIVEDSGWLLKGDDNELGVAMVDDELIPPTLITEYR